MRYMQGWDVKSQKRVPLEANGLSKNDEKCILKKQTQSIYEWEKKMTVLILHLFKMEANDYTDT